MSCLLPHLHGTILHPTLTHGLPQHQLSGVGPWGVWQNVPGPVQAQGGLCHRIQQLVVLRQPLVQADSRTSTA